MDEKKASPTKGTPFRNHDDHGGIVTPPGRLVAEHCLWSGIHRLGPDDEGGAE